MGMQDRTWERLIRDDPDGALDAMLVSLLEEARCEAVALYTYEDEPVRVRERAAGELGSERVARGWREEGDGLREGRPCVHTRWAVWPIDSPQGRRLVYLATDSHDLSRGCGKEPHTLVKAIAEFQRLFEMVSGPAAALEAAVDRFLLSSDDDA